MSTISCVASRSGNFGDAFHPKRACNTTGSDLQGEEHVATVLELPKTRGFHCRIQHSELPRFANCALGKAFRGANRALTLQCARISDVASLRVATSWQGHTFRLLGLLHVVSKSPPFRGDLESEQREFPLSPRCRLCFVDAACSPSQGRLLDLCSGLRRVLKGSTKWSCSGSDCLQVILHSDHGLASEQSWEWSWSGLPVVLEWS